MDWKPIESAPRDGTPFLAFLTKWRPDFAVLRFVADRWDASGWRVCGVESEWVWQDEPTHWMPLPSPPSS
jgi:hypothetical protein